MKAQKGFTLAELLVALACSSLVLLGIITTFGVVMNLQDRAIDTAESTHELTILRDYICQNEITEGTFIIRYGTVAYKGKVIVAGTNVTSITFTDTEINGLPFTVCCISEGNRNYEFLVINTP